MPKKTKKEKIIAQYRRKYKLLEQQIEQKKVSQTTETPSKKVDHQPKIEEKKPLTTIKVKTRETQVEVKKNNENNLLKNFFISDLKKSLLITIILIGIEFFLYFVNIGYLKFYL